jgi:ABC-type amino acid transport substrate-binding protein
VNSGHSPDGSDETPRQRLVGALSASIEEVGYPATTVTDIVRRAKTSRRTFYDYFADREACLVALLTNINTQGLRSIRAAIDIEAPWEVQIAQAVRAWIENEGQWIGFTIELWEQIAQRLGWKTSYVAVTDVKDQLQAVADDKADIAAGGLSITAERERRFDFSQPILDAGLQILVPPEDHTDSTPRSSSTTRTTVWPSGWAVTFANLPTERCSPSARTARTRRSTASGSAPMSTPPATTTDFRRSPTSVVGYERSALCMDPRAAQDPEVPPG